MIRRLLVGVLVCYWLAAFAATHVPVPRGVELPKNSDKVAHFVIYAGLAYLLGLCLWAAGHLRPQKYLLIIAITLVYAVADELLQIPVNRQADFADGTADLIGAIIGIAALHVSRPVLDRLLRRSEEGDQRISPSELGRRQ